MIIVYLQSSILQLLQHILNQVAIYIIMHLPNLVFTITTTNHTRAEIGPMVSECIQ